MIRFMALFLDVFAAGNVSSGSYQTASNILAHAESIGQSYHATAFTYSQIP